MYVVYCAVDKTPTDINSSTATESESLNACNVRFASLMHAWMQQYQWSSLLRF